MKKTAFTLLELVFVIVVLGILAALALPRMDRDLRQEAADNILSTIRYTQHLALNDNKTDPFDGNWQQKLWAIRFTISSTNPDNTYYTVISDMDLSDGLTKAEAAIDPANGKYMYNSGGWAASTASDESPNIFIGKKYGINSLSLQGCSAQHIAFDQLGRPHNGIGSATNTYDKYMSSDCTMTFSFTGGSPNSFSIIIKKETGYAYIVGQPDS